jgi:glycine/D-amino acid oxidase-like deaminating enzyme
VEIGKILWENDRKIKHKGLKLTTLAIIGSGIVGRSLLYNLTTQNFPFDKILLFESEDFAFPCSQHSTAVVASRGVTAGHSPLGDLLLEGFQLFFHHAKNDNPKGVYSVKHYSGCETKLDQFKKRYPFCESRRNFDELNFSKPFHFASEDAFMIEPTIYLNWLMEKSLEKLPLERVKEFVVDIRPGDKLEMVTQNGHKFQADQVVLATGAYSRFWRNLSPNTKLSTSRSAKGSYLEFSDVNWNKSAFSLTLEGHNLIYHAHTKKLLLGSSTDDVFHDLAPKNDLKKIYTFFKDHFEEDLPEFNLGQIKVGQRERAQKRAPYLFNQKNIFHVGGLYKNGYILGLKMTKILTHQLLESV